MSDVLCIYYSRTGKTRQAMAEVAEALDAELVKITDGQNRSGFKGFMLSGMEAMRKSTRPLKPFTTEKELEEYRLVIIGTPVWAGRCSSVVRALLKRRGLEMQNVAYLLTRDSDKRYEEIYEQMDQYVAKPRIAAGSVRVGDVGYAFWRDKLIQEVKAFLG
jgi:menaquinone-dependent protoporphyrinogen IX oxidase